MPKPAMYYGLNIMLKKRRRNVLTPWQYSSFNLYFLDNQGDRGGDTSSIKYRACLSRIYTLVEEIIVCHQRKIKG